jgi:hypothetical protein
LSPYATRDYGDDGEYISDEDNRPPPVTKRYSSHSHTNVLTECGRHSDQWLFGPIIDSAKAVFGSSSGKDKKKEKSEKAEKADKRGSTGSSKS